MNGTREIKNGKNSESHPDIFTTFKHCYKIIFFKDKGLLTAYLNPLHTFNLISIFFIMLLIPYKSPFKEAIFDFGVYIETILLTLFFVMLLYLFLPKQKLKFAGFLRVMCAAEIIDIFNIISFFLPESFLIYFTAIMIGWYFTIIIFVINRLTGLSRAVGLIYVLWIFFLVNLIPAIFQG
jgi:hypothetical protein